MIKRGILLLLVGAILLSSGLVSAGVNGTAVDDLGNIYQCGTINQSGMYTFNQSIFDPSISGNCLTLQASNLYLDGAGFNLSGYLSNNTYKYFQGIYSRLGIYSGQAISNAILTNLTIDGFSTGIYWGISPNNITTSNCTFRNAGPQGYSLGGTMVNSYVVDNNFESAGFVHFLISGDNTTVTNNYFGGSNGVSIRIGAISNANITNNIFNSSTITTLELNGWDADSFWNNNAGSITFSNNTIDGKQFLFYFNISNQRFIKSEIGEISGFVCGDCINITLEGFNFDSNADEGVHISNGKNLTISNSTFNGTSGLSNNEGLSVYNSENILIERNNFTNYLRALDISNVTNLTLNNNYISKSRIGISFSGSSSLTMNQNTVEECLIAFGGTKAQQAASTFNTQNNNFLNNYDNLFLNESIFSNFSSRIIGPGENITVEIPMTHLNLSDYSGEYQYEIKTFPNQSVTVGTNPLSLNYTPQYEGVNSFQIIVNFSNRDSYTRKYSFLLGEEIKNATRQLYLRSTDPEYGDYEIMNGYDQGTVSSEAPTEDEITLCDDFVTFYEQPNYYPYALNNLNISTWIAAEEESASFHIRDLLSGTEESFEIYEFIEFEPSDYEQFNYTFEYNFLPDYSWVQGYYQYYFRALATPIVFSGPNKLSTVDQEYSYSGPKIESFYSNDQRDLSLLSSVFTDSEEKNSTLEFEGEGNFTIVLNVTNSSYKVFYDDIACSTNANCTTNLNEEGIINLTLGLGSYHTLIIQNDVDPPLVTINSPTASEAFSTQSVRLNVTLNEEGTCTYSTNSGITNNTMDTSDNQTFTKTTTFSEGPYTVNFYCNDTLGNRNDTMSVSFSVAVPQQAPSGGGGTPIYYPTETDLSKGYSRSLGKFWKLNFKHKNESHQLKIDSLDPANKVVTITVSSIPQTKTVSVGEEWKVDLNKDLQYDLLVRPEKMNLLRVNLFIKQIDEIISQNNITSNESTNESQETQHSTPTETKEKNTYLIWKIIAPVIIIAFVYYLIRKKKRTKYY